MAYTLTQLAADIRETLKADSGPAGKEKVCGFVSRCLTDKAFVATHLKERAPGAGPREGGVAARARADEPPARALRDMEVHPGEQGLAAEALVHALEADHGAQPSSAASAGPRSSWYLLSGKSAARY